MPSIHGNLSPTRDIHRLSDLTRDALKVAQLPAKPDVCPPRQERTQASWERILDAGLGLIEEHGYEGFTIAAICERAAVSPTAIYARVRTKNALFLAVFDHGFQTVWQQTESTRSSLTGDTSEAVIRNAVAAIALTTFAHARFNRPFILRAEIDPEVASRTRHAKIETARWFRTIVQAQLPDRHGANAEIVDRCFRVIFAALIARVATANALDVGIPYSNEGFIEDLQETAVRWLLPSP